MKQLNLILSLLTLLALSSCEEETRQTIIYAYEYPNVVEECLNGDVECFIDSIWSGDGKSSGVLSTVIVNKFDSAGKLVLYEYYDANDKTYRTKTFEYDGDKLLSVTDSMFEDDTCYMRIISSYEYEYNDGKLTNIYVTTSDSLSYYHTLIYKGDSGYVRETRYSGMDMVSDYTVCINGRIVEKKFFGWVEEDSRGYYLWKYQYLKNGLMKNMTDEIKLIDSSDESENSIVEKSSYEYEYEYDRKGNWTERMVKHITEEIGYDDKDTEYEYTKRTIVYR